MRSLRAPEAPDEKAMLIPPGDYNLKDMADWDIQRKKKKLPGARQLYQDGKLAVKNAADYALGRVTMSQRQEKDREVRSCLPACLPAFLPASQTCLYSLLY